jgi:hypothetical protein
VGEEEADTLAVVGAADGLGNGGRNVNDGELRTVLLLVAEGDRVGDDELGEVRIVDRLDGVATQDTVGNNCHDFFGALFLDNLGCLGESAACVGNVVDENGNLVLDFTDKNLD